MPTTQELKKAWEALDAQIVAKEARLWAKEEARVAAKKARLEEEERVAEEARAQAEEEEWDAVEQDHETGGPSKERAPRRDFFGHHRNLPEVQRKGVRW